MFQGTSHSRSFCLQRINASRTSSCCTRRQCTAQAYRHTHMSRAGEGELNWYCVGQQAGSLRLLAESTCSRHNVFTSFVRLRADRSTGKVLSLHASQSRIVLATFKRNTTSHSPKRPQCLVPPTALSTGRRWNTPEAQLGTGINDLS